eukprot:TRINITY_DN5267_c0_g1_i1.p1 TRINITY_DN5267_c0_g1~~TRINITY_DN5267_c0_g1_i1.p1  ORF type:complete len:893 (-),score=173.01 TRINITY_DN5267_c0_g1_i1:175-2757(-)
MERISKVPRNVDPPTPSVSDHFNENRVSAILFTSGSTGPPKGAIYTEKLMMPSGGVPSVCPLVKIDIQKFHPSFLVSLLSFMRCGGRRVISTDLGKLLDNISIVRPTHISAPPVFFNGLYREYLSRVSRNQKSKSSIAKDIRLILGNRLLNVSSGGAPIASNVIKFCRNTLDLDMADLYGSRESGPIAKDGIVYSIIDVILLSENGDIFDLETQNNIDRFEGEVCVHSTRLIPGYFKDEEKTENAFLVYNHKKYYKTGDLGELFWHENKKRIRLLDRLKDAVKMSNSKWLSPSLIENTLENTPWITQAAVFGDPSHDYPVAVVVLNDNSIITTSDLLRKITFWCKHNHIPNHHIPRMIHVDCNRWTTENGFLTPTLKKKKSVLREHYGDTIVSMFDTVIFKHEKDDTENNIRVIQPDLLDVLKSIIPEYISDIASYSSNTLFELGIDSMAMAQFQSYASQKGVEISLHALYDFDIDHLSEIFWMNNENIDVSLSTYKEIDWANECRLENVDVPQVDKKADSNSVFITGCTGFFGPHLLKKILETHVDAEFVYCLIRGTDEDEATNRLKVKHPKIRILLGDLKLTKFGLTQDIYQEIARNISFIYHSGNYVNLSVPYIGIKQTNVFGTRSVIDFAVMSNSIVSYISSVSALPSDHPYEKYHIPSNLDTYGGYGASKIISEHLLHTASQCYDFPLNVFRISTISGDTETGYFNPNDFTGMMIKICRTINVAVTQSRMRLHWIPADFTADSLVSLTYYNNYEEGKENYYHLAGDGPMLLDIFRVLGDDNIETVDGNDWFHYFQTRLPISHKGHLLSNIFKNIRFEDLTKPVPVTRTISALQNIGKPWFEIDDATIAKYLDYLV